MLNKQLNVKFKISGLPCISVPGIVNVHCVFICIFVFSITLDFGKGYVVALVNRI